MLTTSLLSVAALLGLAVVILWRTKSCKQETTPSPQPVPHPTRCATPYLQNGGRVICQTDDVIEIVTREGTETMTVAEYEARKSLKATETSPE